MSNLPLFDTNRFYEPILLSLKKVWLEGIVTGAKKHEFRRVFLRRPTCAFIYVTSPDSVISHVIWLDAPLVAPPMQIAEIGERERVGGGDSLLAYLQGRRVGFAAPVRGVRTIAPISLREIRELYPRFVPPQSYILLAQQSRPPRIAHVSRR